MSKDTKFTGVWVDHKNAWVISYDDKGKESMLKIKSFLEPKVKATLGTRLAPVAHHKIDGRRNEHSQKFYREIMTKLGDSKQFFLMGPSNAKNELKTSILKIKPLAAKLRETITADHMTERQMAAQVKKFFKIGNELDSIAN
jgi:hypothetical protein